MHKEYEENLVREIERLEKLALILDSSIDKNQLLRKKVVAYAESYLDNISQLEAYTHTDDQGEGILNSPISDVPIDIDEALTLIKDHVDRPGEHLGHGGNMGYIPIGGLYLSALADYLAAITSRYASVFFSAPGGTRMERMLLRWWADVIGYPNTSAGDFTSGGSIANLVAIITAREAHQLRASNFTKSVVYLSEQTHHSIDKALRIAGLGECVKRYVPLDQCFRMQPDLLEKSIAKDKAKGLFPWLIVATAGTTDTGAVDPLEVIAQIAETQGLWLHVDGAYGGAFALCEPGKEKLKGIGRSDSMIVNPHKGFYMPLGSGIVLVRDGYKMHRAHQGEAAYLQDKDVLASPDEMDPADLSIELSRPFRGLRLWLPLKVFGVAPFRAALEEKLLLANYFYHHMKVMEGFELGSPPDLSIVPFRYIPKRGDANEFNRKLVNLIHRDGRIFISSTILNENFTLRVAILGFRTHLATIDLAMEVIREKVEELNKL
jgi:glutamate/tyrosine decarboxylase-like PLP-dependent enzyme